jgi:hypothetical protein
MKEVLDGVDVLVCEGGADLLERVAYALSRAGARASRIEGLPVLLQEGLDPGCLAVVSVSAVHADDRALAAQRTRGRPIVWIDRAPGCPAPAMPLAAQVLPLDFTPAELYRMLACLALRDRLRVGALARQPPTGWVPRMAWRAHP